MNQALLRDALEVSGLSQRELATRCEVHESHLCRILAGKAGASKRLYRDLLLALHEVLAPQEGPQPPWRMRTKVLCRLTPVQVQVLVALHGGYGSRRFTYFITTVKALQRKGLLQPGWGQHLTPVADALIQKWVMIGIYDEVLSELRS